MNILKAIEDSIRLSMQKELEKKVLEDKEYQDKINDIKLDMYLKYFNPFARPFKG